MSSHQELMGNAKNVGLQETSSYLKYLIDWRVECGSVREIQMSLSAFCLSF